MSRTTRLLPWLVAPLLAALPALPAVADPWGDPVSRTAAAPAPSRAPYPVSRTAAAPAPSRAPYPGKDTSWDANEPQRRVAVFGDSLVKQSRSSVEALAATRATAVDVWDLSGGAPCDLLPTYGARVRAFEAERVELAFVGNATTECMTSRIGGRPPGRLSPALRTRIVQVYEADLAALVSWNRASGVRTYLALPPVMAPSTWHGQLTEPLTAALTRLAARYPGEVRVNSAPRDALTPGGTYRSSVVLNGRTVPLRYSDGTHLFAPVGTALHGQALLWPLLLEG